MPVEAQRNSIQAEIENLIRVTAGRGKTLNARDEAVRLVGKYPTCGWMVDDVAALLVKRASAAGKDVVYEAA